jgi:hypothetical protein
MSQEKEVETLFRDYKKKFITIFGSKALTNHTINFICKKLFGKEWIGCYSYDEFPLKTPGYGIINTGKKIGIHWVSVYIKKNTVYVYDSFGRPTGQILSRFKRRLEKNKLIIVESDNDAEQRGNSEVCGHLSISFLCVVKKLGIKKAILI